MTEDPGTVAATTTDYSDYYYQSETEFGELCDDGRTKAFSEVFIPTLYIIIFILGFIGNVVVMWVLIRSRQKFNMTDVCLFNLALSDLLFLVSLPFWAYSVMDEWIFGKFMCHTITGLFTVGLYSRVFFMVLMTVDRYVLIVHDYRDFSRNRPASLVLAVLVWILSLCASLPNIFFIRKIEINNQALCSYAFPEGSAWISFIYLRRTLLSFIFPLIIMGFCFSRIIYALLSKKSQKRHAVTRLILAVGAVYFIFWTPYNIVMFLTFLQSKGHFNSCEWHINLSLAIQWVETIALSQCCLNPFIYAFTGQKFRRAALKVLKETFPFCFSQCTTLPPELSEHSESIECSSAQIA